MNVAHTPPARLVTAALLRSHRIPLLWICALLLTSGVVMAGIDGLGRERHLEDLWWTAAGITTKYWLLVVGVTLVTVHLRSFVTNGITRRAYVDGAAVFGLGMAAALFALMVTAAALHIVTRSLIGHDGVDHLSGGDLVAWSGYTLPVMLAYLVSGVLIGTAHYRFDRRRAPALYVPALLPLFVTEFLLGLDDAAHPEAPVLTYPAALPICMAVIGLGFVVARRTLGGVAILRTAG